MIPLVIGIQDVPFGVPFGQTLSKTISLGQDGLSFSFLRNSTTSTFAGDLMMTARLPSLPVMM
jgi:hypothetical protein